jgi:DNA-binding transcriptional LysR family regulator
MLREEMLLIMPPEHRLASGPRRVDAGQLVGESFIVFDGGSNTRRAVDDFFLRGQIKPRSSRRRRTLN